jgi:hypothetical protein
MSFWRKKSAFDVDVHGFQIEVRRLSMKLKKATPLAVAAGSGALVEEVKKNLSSRKHTLEDLERLDHPYAKRHGSINTSSLGGMKDYEIHDRDGKFAEALKVRKSGAASEVYFDESVAEHIKYVLEGTRTMHGRDVIMGTLNQSGVKDKITDNVRKVLYANLGWFGTGSVKIK